jgi:hypothetical protein
MRRPLISTLLLAACTASGRPIDDARIVPTAEPKDASSRAPDADPGETTGGPGATTSGSRLRALAWVSEDGARQPTGT